MNNNYKIAIRMIVLASITIFSTNASLSRKLGSRGRFTVLNDRPSTNPAYWNRLGKGRRTITEKNGAECLKMMAPENGKGYRFIDGDYAPIESWEQGRTNNFFTRMLFPVKRRSDEYNNYSKLILNPKVIFIRNNKNPSWEDLVYIIGKVHIWATDERIESLLKNKSAQKKSKRISYSKFIEIKLEDCKEATIQNVIIRMKKDIDDSLETVRTIARNPKARQYFETASYDLIMTSLRSFFATKSSLLAKLGANKKQLEFLDKYKEKIAEIKEYCKEITLNSERDAEILRVQEKYEQLLKGDSD